MSGGMYLAAAGALVQQMRLEMLANNVANINTIGYKGEKSVFRIDDASLAATPSSSSEGVQALSPYAPPFAAMIDFTQGAIRQTGNALDVAINGSGFFAIQTPDGVQYTRQGSFTLDADGVLTTMDGHPVLGEGGPITIDEGTVEIDPEGVIYADGDEIGHLALTDFDDPTMLRKAGDGRFALVDETVQSRRPENTTLSQGYLEGSNVQPIQAMTEMIETSRAFEAYQKVIQSADEATAKSISTVGKPA